MNTGEHGWEALEMTCVHETVRPLLWVTAKLASAWRTLLAGQIAYRCSL
jgi:hypothetical protein